MPETDLEKKVNQIFTNTEVMNTKLDAIFDKIADLEGRNKALEARVIELEKSRSESNGFKKGVNWLIALGSGGAAAAVTRLLS